MSLFLKFKCGKIKKMHQDTKVNQENLGSEHNKTNSDNFIETDEVDQAIASELILNPTITDQELANKFGITRQTINRRRRSDAVQSIVGESLSINDQRVRDIFSKSLSKLVELMNSEDPVIALGAAKHISSMGKVMFDGYPPRKNIFDLF
jgi:DNA-directed RNA polymerase sigma subunit (sigma70/sigma32)